MTSEQTPVREDTIRLGDTDIEITVVGTGAWAWGDRFIWGYGDAYSEEDVRQAFDASLETGVNWFDTAELYGNGQSEELLGKFLREARASGQFDERQAPLIATKFMPYPWRLGRGSLVKALRASLERLGLQQVELYQVHHPYPPVAVETWAEALADAVEAGLARAVGVSNYDEEGVRRAYWRLSQRGIRLASNQVEYHLLNRSVEFNGLLDVCRELNVTLIAYSPLAQGLLTGKYTPENPPEGVRGWRFRRERLEAIGPLIRTLERIGEAHGGRTPAQVAVNWCICKGAVPIPGAKNARQARENAGAMGWRLAEAEVAELDEISGPLTA